MGSSGGSLSRAAAFSQGAETPASTPPGIKPARRFRREWLTGYLFILPNVLSVTVFAIGPIVAAFALGLFRWDLLSPPEFVGVGNFAEMTTDATFRDSLAATVLFVLLNVPIQIVLAVIVGVAMNRALRGISFFRVAFLMPWVSMVAAIGLMWIWLYNPDFGLINQFLSFLRIPKQLWLADPHQALPAVVIVTVWRSTGWNATLVLAGLKAIPSHLYEAAAIDGATSLHRLRHISIPLIRPVLFFILVLSVIGSFQTFDLVYVMTSGGPGNSTYLFNLYLYQKAFAFSQMGYAAGMAVVLFFIISLVTFIQMKIVGSRVAYDVR